MNKLNLEKNDEFLNLKKDKQLIYDELVNDTKQSILAEEKRALKYIDDIILPSIRKSNKIGITIRRFLVDDTMSNALSKVLVQQLQKLGFIAFLNKHTDTNKTYIYVTYSINQQDCLPSIIDILNKEHKSTFNIENKAIEDFIHNGIKSEIKKANLDGKTNINVELPNHFTDLPRGKPRGV